MLHTNNLQLRQDGGRYTRASVRIDPRELLPPLLDIHPLVRSMPTAFLDVSTPGDAMPVQPVDRLVDQRRSGHAVNTAVLQKSRRHILVCKALTIRMRRRDVPQSEVIRRLIVGERQDPYILPPSTGRGVGESSLQFRDLISSGRNEKLLHRSLQVVREQAEWNQESVHLFQRHPVNHGVKSKPDLILQ